MGIMTQEDKKLLLTDLSARLTYGVKAYVKYWSKLDQKYYEGVYTVESIHPSLNIILAYSERFSVEVIVGYDDHEIKPYLFPLSSMTEEQKRNLTSLFNCHVEITQYEIKFADYQDSNMDNWNKVFNWCYKNHFDYRGLIPMGLAIDATNLNVY